MGCGKVVKGKIYLENLIRECQVTFKVHEVGEEYFVTSSFKFHELYVDQNMSLSHTISFWLNFAIQTPFDNYKHSNEFIYEILIRKQ